MSYIGSTPTNQSFIAGTDQFTGNGSSTNFTLSRLVNTPNDIQVTIANVVQNPTSYTISGSTLVITPAVANGVSIYVRYLTTTLQSVGVSDGSVTTPKIANGAVTLSKLFTTGTPSSSTYLRGDMTWATVVGVPSGTIVQFGANTAPSGWLECNGAAISRTTYAALFAVTGTTFGAGDGSTTFNLPDMRGYFARGWDNGRGIDSGRAFGSNQAGSVGAHTHGIPTGINRNTNSSVAFPSMATAADTTTLNTYANSGTETRPVNVALLFCIKT